MSNTSEDDKFSVERDRMVKQQLKARGIDDEGVLDAFRTVPRHAFVNASDHERAYDDRALPTRSGQTISQPYMVATMTEALNVQNGHEILEVGTGSGYQTAILLELGATVYTVEKESSLSERARNTLEEIGYDHNISFRVGDGTKGWPEHAPYDRILVTAGAPEVPQSLKDQACESCRIVIPVGSKTKQSLKILRKESGGVWTTESRTGCVFVPLKGSEGWSD